VQGPPVQNALPAQVFQTLNILQSSFVAAVVIYVIVGEVMRLLISDFAPEGFINWGSEIWVIRAVLAALSLYSIVASHFIFTDERMLTAALGKSTQVDDATIFTQLQTTQITRLALSESIAVYGLVLYVMNAERLDLYIFCGVALLNLILIRPRRDRWESAFRSAALTHPGISSSPW
jgi:hypothetical protein